MSSTNFVDKSTPIVADWLNDVNASTYGPTSPPGTLRNDLANTTYPTKGAAMVGFLQAGTGAVSRTVAAKLQESVSVLDFGADPTGVADSTGAFNLAGAASLSPLIPPGTYLLNSNPTSSVIWVVPTVGVFLTGPGILSGTVKRIPVGQNQITLYVDGVNGTDGPLRGRGTGTAACKTIKGAFNNLAQEFDFTGSGLPPLIQCASGQTLLGLDLQQGQTNTPFLVGCNQVTLDGGFSTISNPAGNTLFLRGYPLWLRIQNMTLTAPGGGNLIETYGGGTHVEFNGGITFGAVVSPYAQLSATRYGRISSYPGSTGYTISGGGGMFAQSIIGGRIELEGIQIAINSGITYTQEFVEADGSGSAVEFSNLAWTGSNITGPSYLAKQLGEINLSGQVGGQTINLPLPGGASGGPSVVTNNFTGDGCNGYLPGSTPGAFGFVEGQITDATPPTLTGGGTGAIIQGIEPGFIIVLGTGNGSVSGTQYSFTANLGTMSNWRSAIVGSNDPGSLSNLYAIYTGPTGTTPGNVQIYYTGTGSAPDGKTVSVMLLPCDPNT